MHTLSLSASSVSSMPPSRERLDRILAELTALLQDQGVVSAELWQDNETPHERPGRLELPATQTVFLRIERVIGE
jgi:hypothetical protein